jgi:peptide/nickel transport system permease protein
VARFLLVRTLGIAATILISSVLVFSLVRWIPGDPIAVMLGRSYDPEIAASLRQLYRIDQPIYAQYVSWIRALLQGDFGFSIVSQEPVLEQLMQRIPRTFYLMVGGIATGVIISVPAGILAALYRGRWLDTVVTSFTSVLLSVPQFWLGFLLMIALAVSLRWLPAAGYVDPTVDLMASIRSMVLPWLTVGLPTSAFLTRVLRSSLLDVIDQDYIRTARARGLRETRVIVMHALRNAAIPTVTVLGLEVGYLLGGSIVVEVVFAYPGMGRLIVDSILRRDYPVVQAGLLFFAFSFAVVNMLTDLAYSALDPRVRARWS